MQLIIKRCPQITIRAIVVPFYPHLERCYYLSEPNKALEHCQLIPWVILIFYTSRTFCIGNHVYPQTALLHGM